MKTPSLFWARLGMYDRKTPSYYRVVVRKVDNEGITGDYFYEKLCTRKFRNGGGFFSWRDIISIEVL